MTCVRGSVMAFGNSTSRSRFGTVEAVRKDMDNFPFSEVRTSFRIYIRRITMAAPVSSKRNLWKRRWIGRTLALLAFVLLTLTCLIAHPSSWAAGEQSSFTAEADTFIDGNEPNKNYGDAPE